MNYETAYCAVYHFAHGQDAALHQMQKGVEWSDGIWRTATFLSWSRLPGCHSEAARELNVAVLRIGLLIANEHSDAAEDRERKMGVTRISLDAERRWRRETPLAVRLLRPLRDTVNWF